MAASFIQSLELKTARFSQELAKALPANIGAPQINAAMEHSLLAPGKRIRPIMLLEANKIYGGSYNEALPLAIAVEMIHTYSLIHDDLPCMDDDDLRRGLPSCHAVYGEAMALLAGDGLLNAAYEAILGGYSGSGNPAGYMQAASYIAKAAGSSGMVSGQAADISWEGQPANIEKIEFIHAAKTGALITASIIAGALAAGAAEPEIGFLEEYGKKAGLLYQIVDDILDESGDQQLMGKTAGKDLASNKQTYPSFYGLQAAVIMAGSLADEAVAIAQKLARGNAVFFVDLARYIKSRTN
ncbi:MAG: polyprenyl synthetase family protein [Eubacteriaceae bacterium]|nr:polyprenyl synthetase family protein [Eubacteriaceae bacterium]